MVLYLFLTWDASVLGFLGNFQISGTPSVYTLFGDTTCIHRKEANETQIVFSHGYDTGNYCYRRFPACFFRDFFNCSNRFFQRSSYTSGSCVLSNRTIFSHGPATSRVERVPKSDSICLSETRQKLIALQYIFYGYFLRFFFSCFQTLYTVIDMAYMRITCVNLNVIHYDRVCSRVAVRVIYGLTFVVYRKTKTDRPPCILHIVL